MRGLDRQLDNESKAFWQWPGGLVALCVLVVSCVRRPPSPKTSFPHATAATNTCGQIIQMSYQYWYQSDECR